MFAVCGCILFLLQIDTVLPINYKAGGGLFVIAWQTLRVYLFALYQLVYGAAEVVQYFIIA
jgi:hypothetical protein